MDMSSSYGPLASFIILRTLSFVTRSRYVMLRQGKAKPDMENLKHYGTATKIKLFKSRLIMIIMGFVKSCMYMSLYTCYKKMSVIKITN